MLIGDDAVYIVYISSVEGADEDVVEVYVVRQGAAPRRISGPASPVFGLYDWGVEKRGTGTTPSVSAPWPGSVRAIDWANHTYEFDGET